MLTLSVVLALTDGRLPRLTGSTFHVYHPLIPAAWCPLLSEFVDESGQLIINLPRLIPQ